MQEHLVRTTTLSYILIRWNNLARVEGTTLKPQKTFWLCTWIILKPENSLACVPGLNFALVRVIFAVLSGMMSPNVIGGKIVRWNGKIKFARSAKRRGNMHRKFMPWWSVQSSRKGYLCNSWQKTCDIRSQAWRSFFRKPFCLASSSENWNSNFK